MNNDTDRLQKEFELDMEIVRKDIERIELRQKMFEIERQNIMNQAKRESTIVKFNVKTRKLRKK